MLAALMHAVALGGASMRDVLAWVAAPTAPTVSPRLSGAPGVALLCTWLRWKLWISSTQRAATVFASPRLLSFEDQST
ncbi:MAG: hypothetical protein DLM60_04880 [Pseudonocardiales bacterium]|nr:MAG: hypothetical protein DLM60_04880 [Pseudonocardiales bacterium]